MSRVIFAIPSANAELCDAAFAKWRAWGYATAALLNGPAFESQLRYADHIFRVPEYPGWGASINWLAKQLKFDWLATGGDDMLPPQRHAQDIATECFEHFDGTMGVMQACGDRWLNNSDRICGSPWIGKEFAVAWNGGRGPFWPEYYHHWADNELHDTAFKHGLLWNRFDLSVMHMHWRRPESKRPSPPYMQKAYAMDRADRMIYRRRRDAGFPEHEPCRELAILNVQPK